MTALKVVLIVHVLLMTGDYMRQDMPRSFFDGCGWVCMGLNGLLISAMVWGFRP